MSNKKDDNKFDEEEVVIVEMTDEEGNIYRYEEEMIIPVGEDIFALLVELPDENEHHHDCDCGCGCDDDEGVIIAKIVKNADGDEEYTDPTDAEFEAVMKVYNEMFEEDYAQE